MPEQIESETFIVKRAGWLYDCGAQQQYLQWTNGSRYMLDIWVED